MDKPDQCCGIGTYEHQVCMPIGARVRGIDLCLSHIVAALNAANIGTTWSCCGHSKMHGIIELEDGRHLIVVDNEKWKQELVKFNSYT